MNIHRGRRTEKLNVRQAEFPSENQHLSSGVNNCFPRIFLQPIFWETTNNFMEAAQPFNFFGCTQFSEGYSPFFIQILKSLQCLSQMSELVLIKFLTSVLTYF